MNTLNNDVPTLQAQLAEKTELVAALTVQLERTVTQLDRLRRSGSERQNSAAGPTALSDQSELSGRLRSALDEWQEIQPGERFERIEDRIEQIFELLQTQSSQAKNFVAPTPPAPSSDDFWAKTKARILGDQADVVEGPVVPASSSNSIDRTTDVDDIEEASFEAAGNAPPTPTPITDQQNVDELLDGVNSRDKYIQYLLTRLRLAESKKYLPVNWELVAAAPEQYRDRFESLETLLKDHLRQAEVGNSLERALLARERAKLAQIKHNLELQIKRMATQPALPPPTPVTEPPSSEANSDPERRWKRIFSR